ncbi:hypothetical protein [Thalassoglobus polymorphus]|uniref:Uncharacterized protein n=1 Tax=Thalassoglobus polymorphus TaxID=2527994 RepID=A0A517QH26_9PLAN|nr:hypothetical protein [Thalassoglobus polymorphus]QDT30915.1 hypothetical protein Mal48_01440 [Thalassoglobus polymorphus]QDT30960.1 hypothetical protein Mal48_01890 [Thalassoglobus polymorphus]
MRPRTELEELGRAIQALRAELLKILYPVIEPALNFLAGVLRCRQGDQPTTKEKDK